MASEPTTAPLEYHAREGFLDEVFAGPEGSAAAHASQLVAALEQMGPAHLAAAGRRRDAIFMQQGITFELTGEDGPKDRPFPLDLVPRIIPAEEWIPIKRGLAQRIRALNAFVDDVYHAREIIREGIVPWRLVVSRSHFARVVHGIRPPGGVYTHVAGCDLVRDADGTWKVLEDNVRTPSGISYVLENRVAMTRLVPELFAQYRVRPVDHYPQLLLAALRAVAPSADAEATVVVWTPGPFNSAYFEHAFLARQMGVELVEASDLVVRDDVLYMRTTAGLRRVHAVYRRLDDDFVDPLEFRVDSVLGVPGLVRAYRAGTVAVANAFGTGVADDKAIYHYVPEMIRFYLNEEPILANVQTYLLSDPEQLDYVLGRLDELVVKPTGESGGKGVFIGPATPPDDLAGLADVIRRDPGLWIAQELVNLSTVPTAGSDGALSPRHVDLRPFAVFGETIRIVPGGLTRVALTEGSMIVNSSRGGGSKDTWVLEEDTGAGSVREGDTALHDIVPTTMPGLRYGSEWTGQQQQQQQRQAGVGRQDRRGVGRR
ncbi:circularly permuted type 2 ATP-grasp protein [Baekduia sp.]|uniref:circularly permuted type 2 ATP-grasp protein n=1 Tax=Baekduia sp. TaxID=2600305 RepID=UPI002E064910|nr:circularly permuted type 2 ATP-grasp protein [Baekduia sp.]